MPIKLEAWAASWLLDAMVKKKKPNQTATTNLFARRAYVCKYDLCNATKVRQTKANLLCENINQSCPGTDFIYKVCNHSGQNKCQLLARAPCSSSSTTASLLLHFQPAPPCLVTPLDLLCSWKQSCSSSKEAVADIRQPAMLGQFI